MTGETPYILYVPEIALEKIFSFLSYDAIAKNRIVCRKFNEIGSKMLSRGFIQLEKRHSVIYKRVKTLLPRRESERRAHPLSRHSDILQAIETRISMLKMTYMKYIESNLLCFIPGKVLDEMRSVLSLLELDSTPPRTHHLLQELRDLSSMAMEHFDDHILPRVKEQMDLRNALSCNSPSTSKCPRLFFTQQLFSNELHKVKKQSKNHKHQLTYLTQNTTRLFQKLRRQHLRLKSQSVRIREQERKIREQNAKIQEQETILTDIKKHIDEWDQKYTDLTSELVRARDDILSAAASVQRTPSQTTSTSKTYKSNIKPRMAHILPKNYTNMLSFDMERKRKPISNLLPEIPLKRNRNLNEKEVDGGGEETNKDLPDLIDFKSRIKEGSSGNAGEATTSTASSVFPGDLSLIISNSIENLKNSFSSIKSRKRKNSEEIDTSEWRTF